ncbi:MAG: shikimate dehydrogenase [Dysgonamonadaceae bacterium]|jgi:shikimate dehydrogenase|nr:shikimate dehydrogenase [Dysgonamonadaceae bacterium]
MNKYGLIGFPLTHSFSAKFFTEKFAKEHINAEYLNFEIDDISYIREIIYTNPQLKGLNVTIPYKEKVMPFLDEISAEAREIGAVNTIKINRIADNEYNLVGDNTDYIGFKNSISPILRPEIHKRALILGTGGASKAVAYTLTDLGLEWKYVSRTKLKNNFTYTELTSDILSKYTVIINASPVGTFPNVDECPSIPYEFLTSNHLLYDLVYNPAETLFLKKGKTNGAIIKNGKEMLELQALAAWDIFNSKI